MPYWWSCEALTLHACPTFAWLTCFLFLGRFSNATKCLSWPHYQTSPNSTPGRVLLFSLGLCYILPEYLRATAPVQTIHYTTRMWTAGGQELCLDDQDLEHSRSLFHFYGMKRHISEAFFCPSQYTKCTVFSRHKSTLTQHYIYQSTPNEYFSPHHSWNTEGSILSFTFETPAVKLSFISS